MSFFDNFYLMELYTKIKEIRKMIIQYEEKPKEPYYAEMIARIKQLYTMAIHSEPEPDETFMMEIVSRVKELYNLITDSNKPEQPYHMKLLSKIKEIYYMATHSEPEETYSEEIISKIKELCRMEIHPNYFTLLGIFLAIFLMVTFSNSRRAFLPSALLVVLMHTAVYYYYGFPYLTVTLLGSVIVMQLWVVRKIIQAIASDIRRFIRNW